jgi:hypothetical protein
VAEFFQVGTIAGLAVLVPLALRSVAQLIVVVWSLRADEVGRKHALAVLRVLGTDRRSVTGNDGGDAPASLTDRISQALSRLRVILRSCTVLPLREQGSAGVEAAGC